MGKRKRKRDKGHRHDAYAAKGGEARGTDASAAEADAELEGAAISRRGKKTITAGAALLAAGFYILTLTDPEGRNWASTLSPLLILGSYGVIAFGIFLPEPAREGGEAAGTGAGPASAAPETAKEPSSGSQPAS